MNNLIYNPYWIEINCHDPLFEDLQIELRKLELEDDRRFAEESWKPSHRSREEKRKKIWQANISIATTT